jgi:hypothetical protein
VQNCTYIFAKELVMKGFVLLVCCVALCLGFVSVAYAGDCHRPQQLVLQQVAHPQPIVVQQFVAHPVRQQVVVAPVRQQVVRQQIVQPAVPNVSVVRRGIFGVPRTQVRVGF